MVILRKKEFSKEVMAGEFGAERRKLGLEGGARSSLPEQMMPGRMG